MIPETELLALNLYEEASTEPADGKAAVARVVFNRMRRGFYSDGTITGTVLRKDQFSWAWFEMRKGVYTRVCNTLDEATARAEALYKSAQANLLSVCYNIAQQVEAGIYTGQAYLAMTDDTLLYTNLDISHPAWAVPEVFVCKIGKHSFYRSRASG